MKLNRLLAIILCFAIGLCFLVSCKPQVPYPKPDEEVDIYDDYVGYNGTDTIYDMRTEDLINPIGIDVKTPAFSWKVKSKTVGWNQTAYQITVFNGPVTVWDTGKVIANNSVNIRYDGEELLSSTRYRWSVTVWDGEGRQIFSPSATFETGLLCDSDFVGVYWISCAQSVSSDSETNDLSGGLPAFRKSFDVGASLLSAKLYTSGLGVYESFINGQRVGNLLEDGTVFYEELKPGFTEMSKRKFYNSYDVTHMLEQDTENVLSAVVSSGWWSGGVAANYGKEDAYWAKLILNYSSGSTVIVTDSTWKSSNASAIISADIFDGETYDARINEEWKTVEFDDDAWEYATVNTEFNGELCAWNGVPIVVRSDLELKVESVAVNNGIVPNSSSASTFGRVNVIRNYVNGSFTLNAGETAVVDFGQNFAGWELFEVTGERGTTISVRHGEMLNDDNGLKSRGNDGPEGSIYNANYRSAKATTKYILSGDGKEVYHPSFTFYGFRYAEFTTDKTVTFNTIVGQVVTSVNEDTGNISTSNSNVNQLVSNIRWGQYSNYLSVPSDCPQRDERQGWAADTQVFSEAGSYLAFSKSFLEKFMQDMRDSQRSDGAYAGTAPTGCYNGGDWGGTGWADAGIIVPYNLYKMYGDVNTITENWQSMTKYMDYLATTDKYGGRPVWGDWLAYESNDNGVREILGVAFYAWDAKMMAEMATVLGKADEAQNYYNIFNEEKSFFNSKYVSSSGKMKRGEQTVCLYALYLDLLESENSYDAVANQLVSNIKRNNYRLQTGFLGTAIIMPTLIKIGRTDIAYSLLLQHDNPSWLYSVDQGATTIWERWNSYTLDNGFGDVGMNSFNHYAYGSVASWMFKHMAGIGFDDTEAGFKKVVIAPHIDARIEKIKASYDSAYGEIYVFSQFKDSAFKYKVILPANVTAEIRLPLGVEKNSVTVNGKNLTDLDINVDGVRYNDTFNGELIFTAVSGTFEFCATVK